MSAKRILLVDNDLFLAKIIERELHREGFEMAYAGNGETALRMMGENRPDAVVLAVAMPKKNGFEVLEAMKDDQALASIPVIMLTNASAKEDVERCLCLGACEYFIKSQHAPEEVVRRLKHRLNLKPAFTLAELLVVLGVILVAGSVAFWQYGNYQAKSDDAKQIAAAEQLRSSLVAAGQEHLQLVCPTDMSSVWQCQVCSISGCQGAGDRSKDFLWIGVPYEQDVDYSHPCEAQTSDLCMWMIEQNGSYPLSLDHFKIRFFLERGVNGLAGGMTHTIDETGHLE